MRPRRNCSATNGCRCSNRSATCTGSASRRDRKGYTNGAAQSRLQLFAPTADALHSTNVDTATVDEAWAFDIETGDAIEAGVTPAQLTRPWRQTWIVSAGGTVESTWWDRWLTAGGRRVYPVSPCSTTAPMPTAPDYDPADPAVWVRAHPTAGVAFPLEVLAAGMGAPPRHRLVRAFLPERVAATVGVDRRRRARSRRHGAPPLTPRPYRTG